MKKIVALSILCLVMAYAQGALAHCDPGHVEELTLAHCDPGHVESLTLAVERKSCHCGFSAAGDCKPCTEEHHCTCGWDGGKCLPCKDADMKHCKCGWDAGKCLPCKDTLIERSEQDNKM